MKSIILAISDNNKHFSTAISEYTKRLGKDVEIIDIKPEKNGNREQIIQKETEKMIQYIEKKSTWSQKPHIILLEKEGKQRTTEQFMKTTVNNGTTYFIIGWPYWLDTVLLKTSLQKTVSATHIQAVAFGEITLPHGLAKLVLLEQIYRAKMIQEGREYHY